MEIIISNKVNKPIGQEMTTLQVIIGAVILFAASLTASICSYPVTVTIFKQKEY